jgi:hypothetical protein
MKIFLSSFLLVIGLLATLFFYQNWSRSISLDMAGNSLSFDLLFWGMVWTGELSASVFALIMLSIGLVGGVVLPKILSGLLKSSDSYE